MSASTFEHRRGQIETYFDRTAADAWARLTSTEQVGGIRATVRAGRDRMRTTLLGYLDPGLADLAILDAGCGTGAMSSALVERGAAVTAIDLSPTLINVARRRLAEQTRPGQQSPAAGSLRLLVGDMTEPGLGRFDHVVAMDSLIHYTAADVVRVLANYAQRTERSILFTFAPRTTLLALMHAVGQIFPRGNRSPSIEPVAEHRLRARLAAEPALQGWRIGRTKRIASGFYTSQAMELVRG